MTEKLYYSDPHCYQFEARIIERTRHAGKLALVLDRTCFYPEGGGQPADQGKIENAEVYDVQEYHDKILHYVNHDVTRDKVQASINEVRRHDYMQQHTGQHLLSQALLRVGKINTVSVHFGEQETYIETDADSISDKILEEVEDLTNLVIRENAEVKTLWIDASEVDHYHIRRPPPDVSQVRIVQLGDFDATACGGLHVSSTGQVGLCKITGSEKIRGRTRIHAKVGDRAYRDYHFKTQLLNTLGRNLTCGEDAILKRVEDLNSDYTRLKRAVLRYQTEWISLLVDEIFRNAPSVQGVAYAQFIFEDVDNKVLKLFIENALTVSQRIVVLVNRQEDKLTWMIGQSMENPIDLKALVTDLLTIIDAKGGGSRDLIQGGGNNIGGIDDFISKVRIKLERKLKGHE